MGETVTLRRVHLFLALLFLALASGSACAGTQAEEAYFRAITAAPHLVALNEQAKKGLQENHYKVVFIWASWCPYCKKTWPELKQIASEFRRFPLDFIAVSTEKSERAAKAFAQTKQGPLKLFYFKESLKAPASIATYPSIGLLDPQGNLVAAYSGYQRERLGWLEKEIRWIMREGQE